MANRPRKKETICERCAWAKDKVNNPYVFACYCVQYGYIVSQPKDLCKGFMHCKPEGEEDHDGNVTGTDSTGS